MIPVYCMPGMAANPKIFEYLDFPEPYQLFYLKWFSPKRKESLGAYALRMCSYIKHDNPILIGVSFGGVLVQEMASHIAVRKVVIVSSIKSNLELPLPMKMAQKTNAHKLLPTQWIKNIDTLTLFAFGKGIKTRLSLYQKYLSERDPDYLNWAIDCLVHWNQDQVSQDVLHIHGVKDTVFPIKNLLPHYIPIPGGHAAIITQAKWFNDELPKLLSEFS
jgi:pimeloyl-ACP methyl ester carboxylesterase